jgi:preprotein translocase subunit YajC
MSFLISDALAAAPPEGQPDPLMSFLPLVLIFVVFYFLLIRPQTKRAKEHKKMVGLAKGDEVVTSGGLLGRITQVGENFVQLKVAEGVEVKIQKQAVSTLMPKGTVKES